LVDCGGGGRRRHRRPGREHRKVAGAADRLFGSYLRPQGTVELSIVDSGQRVLIVALSAGSEVKKMDELTTEKPVVFEVPANAGYKLLWNGPGYKSGSYDLLVPAKRMRWAFRQSGREQDLETLELRLEGEAQAVATAPAPADLLIAASAARIAQNPALRPPGAGIVPELDRALAVIGLLEVGTTDCGSFVNAYRAGGTVMINVGCLAMGIPGWLAEILRKLDQEQPAVLDAALGSFAAPLRRAVSATSFQEVSAALQELAEPEDQMASLTAALRRLVQTPSFRVAHNEEILRQ
jgi:hypothetical protein